MTTTEAVEVLRSQFLNHPERMADIGVHDEAELRTLLPQELVDRMQQHAVRLAVTRLRLEKRQPVCLRFGKPCPKRRRRMCPFCHPRR